eukprot:5099892-Pleurochrysis_carterae.AAC.2
MSRYAGSQNAVTGSRNGHVVTKSPEVNLAAGCTLANCDGERGRGSRYDAHAVALGDVELRDEDRGGGARARVERARKDAHVLVHDVRELRRTTRGNGRHVPSAARGGTTRRLSQSARVPTLARVQQRGRQWGRACTRAI